MGVSEGVWHVVLVGALIDIQHSNIHRDGDGAPKRKKEINRIFFFFLLLKFTALLEFDSVSERVPSKERCSVRDLPHGDEAAAVEIGRRPMTLLQVCGAVVLGEVLVAPQVDVVAALLRSEKHLEPKLLEVVVIV